MANLDFPSNPYDGQPNEKDGRKWEYHAAKGVWRIVPVTQTDADFAASKALEANASAVQAAADRVIAQAKASEAADSAAAAASSAVSAGTLGNIVTTAALTPVAAWTDVPGLQNDVAGAVDPIVAIAQALLNRTESLRADARLVVSNLDNLTGSERQAVLAGSTTFDATAKTQAAIDAAAAQGAELVIYGRPMTGLLSSAADDLTIRFAAAAELRLKVGTYVAGSFHLSLTGKRVTLIDFRGDGNQYSQPDGSNVRGFLITGISPTVIRARPRRYSGTGHITYSNNAPKYETNVAPVRKGVYIDCAFDDNAGLGCEVMTVAYVDFLGCTFDRNGYGFKKTRANPADLTYSYGGFVGLAFGCGVRYRSNHVEFLHCHWRDNGKDGLCINQGSWAIKVHGTAIANDDAGIAIAADNDLKPVPGEAESCFDLDINVETANNLCSGIAIYQPAYNVKLRGRSYNNNRIAGSMTPDPDAKDSIAFKCGVFIATGSKDIDVDMTVYDDRQARQITAINTGTGVISATDWTPGTRLWYPKVAFYSGSTRDFLGYATITAESSGSVTVVPTANLGVVLSTLAAGDTVTQAVQHWGVFFSNSCSGRVKATGFGHTPFKVNGSSVLQGGQMLYSGAYGNDQNVWVDPSCRYGATELLANPGFDTATGGNTIEPWSIAAPAGASYGRVTSGPGVKSAAAFDITGGTTDIALFEVGLDAAGLNRQAGSWLEFSAQVTANAPRTCAIAVIWTLPGSPNVTLSTSVNHPGGGLRVLRVGAFIPQEAIAVGVRGVVAPQKSARFDNLSWQAFDVPQNGSDADKITHPFATAQ